MKIADTLTKLLAVTIAASLPVTAAMAQPAQPAPAAAPATVTTTTTTVAEDPVATGVNTVAPGAVQTAATIAPPPPAAVDAPPVTTVTTTTTAAVPPVPAPPPAMVVPAPAVTSTITNAPAGMPSVVGEVMQNLQQSQNNLSLNDVAKAQDALVRLNLMLDIEKKMGDLKKVQDERNGVSNTGGGMAAMTPFGAPNLTGAMQVPASALALPEPAVATAPAPERRHTSRPADDTASAASDYTVEQISGTNGNLVAVLLSSDGTRKNVRVGDTVGSRLKVASISGSGVQLQGPKGSKTIAIENNGLAFAPLTR